MPCAERGPPSARCPRLDRAHRSPQRGAVLKLPACGPCRITPATVSDGHADRGDNAPAPRPLAPSAAMVAIAAGLAAEEAVDGSPETGGIQPVRAAMLPGFAV